MIDRLLANPSFKPFLLEPETVAKAIVKQVLSGKSGQVILPGRLSVLSALRAFPAWFQEMIRSAIAQEMVVNDDTKHE